MVMEPDFCLGGALLVSSLKADSNIRNDALPQANGFEMRFVEATFLGLFFVWRFLVKYPGTRNVSNKRQTSKAGTLETTGTASSLVICISLLARMIGSTCECTVGYEYEQIRRTNASPYQNIKS
jgi:hypothetical protein